VWATHVIECVRVIVCVSVCVYVCVALIQQAYQVSISPTFYEQLIHTNMCCTAFPYLHFGFVIIWQTNIGSKAARKVLVKLTTGGCWWCWSSRPFCKTWPCFFEHRLRTRLVVERFGAQRELEEQRKLLLLLLPRHWWALLLRHISSNNHAAPLKNSHRQSYRSKSEKVRH